MEVDPVVGLLLPGVPELLSRPIYAEVVAGLQAIGQRTTPLDQSARIEGAFAGYDLSSDWLLGRLVEVADAPLPMPPRPKPIRLVRSG